MIRFDASIVEQRPRGYGSGAWLLHVWNDAGNAAFYAMSSKGAARRFVVDQVAKRELVFEAHGRDGLRTSWEGAEDDEV